MKVAEPDLPSAVKVLSWAARGGAWVAVTHSFSVCVTMDDVMDLISSAIGVLIS